MAESTEVLTNPVYPAHPVHPVGPVRSLLSPGSVALALGLTALLGLLYLAQSSGVASTGYDVQELEAQRARWELRNAQLRIQVAEARSLDRIEREARQRLGMGPPAQVLHVPPPAASGPAAAAPRGEAGVIDGIGGIPGDGIPGDGILGDGTLGLGIDGLLRAISEAAARAVGDALGWLRGEL